MTLIKDGLWVFHILSNCITFPQSFPGSRRLLSHGSAPFDPYFLPPLFLTYIYPTPTLTSHHHPSTFPLPFPHLSSSFLNTPSLLSNLCFLNPLPYPIFPFFSPLLSTALPHSLSPLFSLIFRPQQTLPLLYRLPPHRSPPFRLRLHLHCHLLWRDWLQIRDMTR